MFGILTLQYLVLTSIHCIAVLGQTVHSLSNGDQTLPQTSYECFPKCVNEGVCTKVCPDGGRKSSGETFQCPSKLIESCTCPDGYEGSSCEVDSCLARPLRIPTMRFTISFEDPHRGSLECADGYKPLGTPEIQINCEGGRWTPSAEVVLLSDFSCEPICSKAALNQGLCLAPNFYNCPYPYGGTDCSKRLDQDCEEIDAEIDNGELVAMQVGVSSDSLKDVQLEVKILKCGKGFGASPKSPLGAIYIQCLDGNWTLPDDSIFDPFSNNSGLCEPVCEPACENGGECVGPNNCQCPVMYQGPNCGQVICATDPPTINNIVYDDKAKPPVARCSKGYQLSNGLESTTLSCSEDGWSFDQFGKDVKVSCVKITACPGIPPKIQNAVVKDVSPGIKEATCNQGFRFPSGKNDARISCPNGVWTISGDEALNGGCVPYCERQCLNGGFCYAPNICSCPPNAEGGQCQLQKCQVKPFAQSLRHLVSNETLDVFCDNGTFINGELSLRLLCENSEYQLPFPYPKEVVLKCFPKCYRRCRNGGACDPAGVCVCLPAFGGPTCEEKVHCDPHTIPFIDNSKITEIREYDFVLRCNEGYKLPGNIDTIAGSCSEGNWTLDSYTMAARTKLMCSPYCEGGCSGQGACVAPAQCQCLPGFMGPTCNVTKDPGCHDAPPKVLNSLMVYNLTKGSYSCFPGYAMVGGLRNQTLICSKGRWDIPDCECNDMAPSCDPVCDPQCLNGGICVAPNTCQCPDKYEGRWCQILKPRQCLGTISPIPNSNIHISMTGSFVKCKTGYQFASGRTNESLWCDDGEWRVSSYSTSTHTSACFPVCQDVCLNNGKCTAPNFCQCIEPFTGPGCERLRTDLCWTSPIAIKYAVTHYSPFQAYIKCLPGYSFEKNQTTVKIECNQGLWAVQESFLRVSSCFPVCSQQCLNGGSCIAPETCECLKGFGGKRCEVESEEPCQSPPEPVAFSTISFSKEKAHLSCQSGYRLSSGYSEVDIICFKGNWVVSFQTHVMASSLECAPVCERPCQHGGVCVGPNTCQCTEVYTGQWCEHKKCFGDPTQIPNSEIVFGEGKLYGISRCISGYRLRWGSLGIRFECIDGHWQYQVSESQWLALECHPVCEDPCLNGGRCVAPNTCRCPEGFFGAQCHKRYSKTITGKSCHFPFRYQDRWYYGCTGVNYHRPWCAVSTNAQNLITSWAVCVADLGRKKVVLTYSGDACVFPFRYRGQDFSSCTARDRGKAWCATEINSYNQIVKWGFCNPNWGSQMVILTVRGELCELPFSWRGKRFATCVDEPLRPWCATATSNGTPTKHGYCITDWGYHRITMTTEGNICIFPFVHESHTYDSCFESRGRRTCAVKVDDSQTALRFEECIHYSEGSDAEELSLSELFPRLGRQITDITTVLKHRCVLPFWFEGEQFTECSYKNSPRPWCATAIDDNGVMIDRDFCPPNWDIPEVNFYDLATPQSFEFTDAFSGDDDEVALPEKAPPRVIAVKGRPCVFPFTYKGASSYGCVEDGFQRPWCATKVDEARNVDESDHCPDNWDSTICSVENGVSDELLQAYGPSQSPKTETGHQCIIPFVYLGKTYVTCTYEDAVQAWCPTRIDSQGTPVTWDYCAQGWEKEEPSKESETEGGQILAFSVCEYKRFTRDVSANSKSPTAFENAAEDAVEPKPLDVDKF